MQLWEQFIRLQKEDGSMKQYQEKMWIQNNLTQFIHQNERPRGILSKRR